MWTKAIPPIFRAALFAGLAIPVGCSSGPRGRVTEVEGIVKLDGTPLTKVSVQFVPEGELSGSTAVTDDEGHYALRTSDGRPGAIVGRHKVMIRAERNDERSGAKGSPRSVPAKYTQSNPENPLGTVDVDASKKTGYDFDLKSQ